MHTSLKDGHPWENDPKNFLHRHFSSGFLTRFRVETLFPVNFGLSISEFSFKKNPGNLISRGSEKSPMTLSGELQGIAKQNGAPEPLKISCDLTCLGRSDTTHDTFRRFSGRAVGVLESKAELLDVGLEGNEKNMDQRWSYDTVDGRKKSGMKTS